MSEAVRDAIEIGGEDYTQERYDRELFEINDFGLKEMYLLNVIILTSDKTANVTSAPDFYKFYKAVRMLRLAEANGNKDEDLSRIGKEIEFEETALWSILILLHQRVSKIKGNNTNAEVIHHDDVEGLFRTTGFIEAYERKVNGLTGRDQLWNELIDIAERSTGQKMTKKQA